MTPDIYSIIAFCAALTSSALAVAAFLLKGRSLPHQAFGLGMIALAADRFLSVLAAQSVPLSEVAYWEWWRLVALSLICSSWLLFSLTFVRENYRDFVSKWKWALLFSLAAPLSLSLVFRHRLFGKVVRTPDPGDYFLLLDQAGFFCYLIFLLTVILILFSLEKTLRSLYGAARWRIKFTILGIGAVFSLKLYYFAQALLYGGIRAELSLTSSVALLLACMLIAISVARDRFHNTAISVSHEFLHNSITVIIIGIYLLSLGVMAKLSLYFGVQEILSDTILVIFLSLIGGAVILLSDRRRREIRTFIYKHFKKPHYDYRNIWTAFTRRTTSLVDLSRLCTEVSRAVCEIFHVKNVNIWLQAVVSRNPVLYGSTTLSQAQVRDTQIEKEAALLMDKMRDRVEPVAFDRPDPADVELSGLFSAEFLKMTEMKYCVSLTAGGEFLGILTLDGQMSEQPFSLEDFDLLKTIADQAAAKILSHRLFENLSRAKEIEFFQAVSTFFVHDLKNVASTLSLTLQNFPAHFDNPEFRKDALKMLSGSADKITQMCSMLSALNKKLELNLVETDMNALLKSVINRMNGSVRFIEDLGQIPAVAVDVEHIQKVLLNLFLNAREATVNECEIHVLTRLEGDQIIVGVSDNGCGMSREFIEESLFQPYRTTKKRGLGIGLFQCKMIVDAHKGRIEVSSEVGKGSMFRIRLPAKAKSLAPAN